MLVAIASPARTALKNSQLACGERHAYFGDRTLGPRHKSGRLGDPTLPATTEEGSAQKNAKIAMIQIGDRLE
jgi:hypothetical protein